jgi:hypothetical protein
MLIKACLNGGNGELVEAAVRLAAELRRPL